MDQNNKSQELVPVSFEDIPNPDEHAREVKKIFRVFGAFAGSFVTVAIVAITIALLRGVPPSTVAVFAMLTMNVCVITFGVGYACPVGLVSLRRLEIAYRMGYVGLGMNRKAAGAMETIARKIERETAPVIMKQRQTTEA